MRFSGSWRGAARPGGLRHGMVWFGKAGKGLMIPVCGGVRCGTARSGRTRRGQAWCGMARQGEALGEKHMKSVKMQIDKIVIDEHLYPRNKVNDYHVARLKYALKAGAVFPPLTIEKLTRRLVDGRHRYTAYVGEGIKEAS